MRANWSETDLVELTIHGISELDVRNAAMNANCYTITELLVFLSSYVKSTSKDKEFRKKSGDWLVFKRSYPTSEGHEKALKHCYQCGKWDMLKQIAG